jgi:hypothetical protein
VEGVFVGAMISNVCVFFFPFWFVIWLGTVLKSADFAFFFCLYGDGDGRRGMYILAMTWSR